MLPHQAAVDGDALFSSVPRRSGPLKPLRTRQVHKVKLGRQRLKLVDVGAVGQPVVCHVVLGEEEEEENREE